LRGENKVDNISAYDKYSASMNCPHCNKPIPADQIAAHLGSIGGKKSKRKITSEQQRKMQAARNESLRNKINNNTK
jgi:hypothetical protein